VPKPIDHNRHAIVMEYVGATLLNNIEKMAHAQRVYERCLELLVKLARHGLVHGDFNEFNLFVRDDYNIIMIDFPQMVSIDHPNASELFDRDVNNLALFFERRFGITKKLFPKLETDVEREAELDRMLMASGFSRQEQRDLERMMEAASDEEDEEDEDDGAFETDAAAARAAVVRFETPAGGDDEAAASAAAAAPAPAPEGSDAESADEEAEEAEDASPSIATTAITRRPLNPNILPGGAANMEHIKARIKAQLRRDDEHDFHRNMHRNVMKGREKRRIKTQVKNAHAAGGTLDDCF
jgi:RIO kinase 2